MRNRTAEGHRRPCCVPPSYTRAATLSDVATSAVCNWSSRVCKIAITASCATMERVDASGKEAETAVTCAAKSRTSSALVNTGALDAWRERAWMIRTVQLFAIALRAADVASETTHSKARESVPSKRLSNTILTVLLVRISALRTMGCPWRAVAGQWMRRNSSPGIYARNVTSSVV